VRWIELVTGEDGVERAERGMVRWHHFMRWCTDEYLAPLYANPIMRASLHAPLADTVSLCQNGLTDYELIECTRWHRASSRALLCHGATASQVGPTICQRWLCPVSTIPLPFFRCRFAVAVSRCRFRTLLPLPLPLRIAVYGCNGTEFSYIIFTEQWNFTTAERRNGNGRTATEWWKPGITFGEFSCATSWASGLLRSQFLIALNRVIAI